METPPPLSWGSRTIHLIHKVAVGDLVGALIQEGAGGEALQPGLALLNLLFGEGQLQAGGVLVTCNPQTRACREGTSGCGGWEGGGGSG